MINHEKTQRICPDCGGMYCPGDWQEGVCPEDMNFCGEPTADGDEMACALRVWYEAHRETWWERKRHPMLYSALADNFMLGLINEVHRISCVRELRRQRREKNGNT